MEQFCEMLLYRLRKKREELHAPLLNNSMNSLESYRYACGKIKAYEEAEVELKTLYKQMLQKETLNPKDWKNYDEIKLELYRNA